MRAHCNPSLQALAAAEKVFGTTRNGKGFKVIPGCGVIQGDGIDLPTMEKIALVSGRREWRGLGELLLLLLRLLLLLLLLGGGHYGS